MREGTHKGDTGKNLHCCLKRLKQYLLAPKLFQQEASAVKKLGKNNKTTPLARAGNTLAHVWLINERGCLWKGLPCSFFQHSGGFFLWRQ